MIKCSGILLGALLLVAGGLGLSGFGDENLIDTVACPIEPAVGKAGGS